MIVSMDSGAFGAKETSTHPAVYPPAQITLEPASVARALAVVAALLILASCVALLVTYRMGQSPHDVRIAQLFYLDGERNIPTAFSTFLLLAAALLLAFITTLERSRPGSMVLHWSVLSGGFAFMAIDEAWSFHEKLTAPMRAMLGNDHLGIYYYAWVVPAIALLLALGLFFLRFLLRLPPRTRLSFLLAGAIYVGGAVGIELIEGRFDELHGDRNLISGITGSIQETLEMTGVIVFIWALLVYLRDSYHLVRIRFDRAGPGA